jgi:predicted glutamine amidotransferase
MCGIIAMFDKRVKGEDVNEAVVNQYEEQFNRGTDGYGAVFIAKDGSYKIKRATEATKALIDLYMNPSKMILFHHRQPTSTDNFMDQTHPMVISHGSLKHDYLVVHNGIISNDDELKAKHEKLGFIYRTQYTEDTTAATVKFNDSECLAIEVARYIEEQSEEIDTFSSAAFVALQIDKKTDKVIQVFFGKSQASALNIHSSAGRIELSSEGRGAEVTEQLWSFNIENFKLKSRALEFKSYISHDYGSAAVKGFEEESYAEPASTVLLDNKTWITNLNSEDDWEINNELETAISFSEDALSDKLDEYLAELKNHEKVFKADPIKTASDLLALLIEAKQECEKVAEKELQRIAKGEKKKEDLTQSAYGCY